MRITIDGLVRSGQAVEVGMLEVEPERLFRAVRDGDDIGGVRIACQSPSPVHERIGLIQPEMGLSIRSTLAVIARNRGLVTPKDDQIAAIRTELSNTTPAVTPVADVHEAIPAPGSADLERLRERVATLRGKLAARDAGGGDTETARLELAEAIRAYADARTERIATRQQIRRVRQTARVERDDREHRLQLQDRLGNLKRAARKHLAMELRDDFAAAVDTVPGDGTVPAHPNAFSGEAVVAALALARMASLEAPVVLNCDRFCTAAEAATILEAPVIRTAATLG